MILSVDLPEDLVERLRETREMAGLDAEEDVLVCALASFESLVRAIDSGGEVFVEFPDGRVMSFHPTAHVEPGETNQP